MFRETTIATAETADQYALRQIHAEGFPKYTHYLRHDYQKPWICRVSIPNYKIAF